MGSIDKSPPRTGVEASAIPLNEKKGSKAPASVGRGIIEKTHVTKLRAVPKSAKNKDLEEAMQRLKTILKQTPPASPGPFSLDEKRTFYNALCQVLVIMTEGRRDNDSLHDATEILVSTFINDKRLSSDVATAKGNEDNIRAASGYFSRHLAIDPTTTNLTGDALKEARIRLMRWIVPLYEIKTEQRAHLAFLRLLSAAQEVKERSGPDSAARLMAWVFKSEVMPISLESDKNLGKLWSCLSGAHKNADLIDAQRLLNRYRDEFNRHAPKTE